MCHMILIEIPKYFESFSSLKSRQNFQTNFKRFYGDQTCPRRVACKIVKYLEGNWMISLKPFTISVVITIYFRKGMKKFIFLRLL